MPTDMATPIWRCDICRERFGKNLEAAQRCEAAGPPVVLPDGELALEHSSYSYSKGFRLIPLHPVERIGTETREWQNGRAGNGMEWRSGHFAHYEPEGILSDHRPVQWPATGLWPHDPSAHYLNVHTQPHASGLELERQHSGDRAGMALWPFELTGLPATAERIEHLRYGGSSGTGRVGPITPEVRDVFDLLHATVERPQRPMYGQDGAEVIAAENTSARDGLPPGTCDPARLSYWLAQSDPDELYQETRDRWEAWGRGEPVTVPVPRMISNVWRGGGRITKSKLRVAERKIIDAAGVEWFSGNSAEAYLAHLIREALGVTMTDTTEGGSPRLFSTVEYRLAVTSSKGGVGKTTVTGAVAAALVSAGKRVLIVDMNLPNPGQHILWGLGPMLTDPAAKLIRGELVEGGAGELRVFSHGQLTQPGNPGSGLMDIGKAGEWLAFLGGCLDTRDVDVILFDMPPGWDAAHRSVFDQYQVGLTGVVHVTTGHPLAIEAESLPGANSYRETPYPRWLVENMSRASGPRTDGPGHAEIRLHGTDPDAVRHLAERQKATYAGSLPWESSPVALGASAEILALAAALTTAEA